jgi:hypothetical protein
MLDKPSAFNFAEESIPITGLRPAALIARRERKKRP